MTLGLGSVTGVLRKTIRLKKKKLDKQPIPAVVHVNAAKTVAHRGICGHVPENTMAAFEKALEAGYDYIELDVQMSADGKLVVIHDKTVDRTTNGSGKINNMSWEELKQLDAGSWYHAAFSGEKIPLLEEVLDKFSGRIGFLIDLKRPSQYPGIEDRLADMLRSRKLTGEDGNVIVQSFDFRTLKAFHRLLPEVPVGILIRTKQQMTQRKLEHFSTFAKYINPRQRLVNIDSADRIHRHGMGIMVWTVKNPENISPLLSAGVDGMITNHPLFTAEIHEMS